MGPGTALVNTVTNTIALSLKFFGTIGAFTGAARRHALRQLRPRSQLAKPARSRMQRPPNANTFTPGLIVYFRFT